MSGDNIRLIHTRREPHLAGDGGGPHDPNMEARLTRLEAVIEGMRSDMSATRSDTSYMRGRIESLPTTWSMIATVIGGNIALAGVIFAIARFFGRF